MRDKQQEMINLLQQILDELKEGPKLPNHCSECGLILEGAIGYVCSNPKCPCGLGGVQC